tara:strand:- start:4400 stop:4954 length:555 start_codon:yes stop_codon:yes gene_type:complete
MLFLIVGRCEKNVNDSEALKVVVKQQAKNYFNTFLERDFKNIIEFFPSYYKKLLFVDMGLDIDEFVNIYEKQIPKNYFHSFDITEVKNVMYDSEFSTYETYISYDIYISDNFIDDGSDVPLLFKKTFLVGMSKDKEKWSFIEADIFTEGGFIEFHPQLKKLEMPPIINYAEKRLKEKLDELDSK